MPLRVFCLSLRYLLCGLFLVLSLPAHALLSMELTRGVAGAIPVSIVPFPVESGATPSVDVAAIVSNDLRHSGRITVQGNSTTGVDAVLRGSIKQTGSDSYRISYVLQEGYAGKKGGTRILLAHSLTSRGAALRRAAHHVSDQVYQQLTGIRGIFSTRIAYVLVKRDGGKASYSLELSDADGDNPRQLLISAEPVMSPAFSPDGRKIAYVSFEKKRAAIYLQDIASGHRELLSARPGINGAPAFSPDGRHLALVLSEGGAPNLYLMDLASRTLRQLTHGFSINTEPAFSPDGKSLIFTSNRGGTPQIYQVSLTGGVPARVTYDGNYNARASFTPDGRHIVVINQTSGLFNIAMLDLDSGIFRVLTATSGTDNESPVLAPNGNMVLYGTVDGGHNVLAMASTDGSVQIRLPARDGDVQDPAWSPWVS